MVSIYQSATAGALNVAQVSVTLQKTSVAGDLVLIVVQASTNTAQVAAVTDNYGNQYQRLVRQSTTTDEEIWYGVISKNQNYTFTVALTSAAAFQATVIELSGVNTNAPFACANGQSGQATPSQPTVTLNPACGTANTFIVTTIGGYNTQATSPPPEWGVLNGFFELVDATFTGTSFEAAIAYGQTGVNLGEIQWSEAANAYVNWDALTLIINPTPTYQAPSGLCGSLPFPLNDICNAFSGLLGFITNVGQGIFGGLTFVAQGIIHFADQIYNGLVAFGQWFVQGLQTIGSLIAKAFTTAYQALASGLQQAFQFIQGGLTQLGAHIRCGLIDIINMVINGINWLVDTIEGGIQYIANGILNGVSTLITSIESVVIAVQNAVVSRIKNVLFVTLTTPAELKIARSLFEGFTSGGDMKVGRKLIGLVATPIIAKAVTDFIAGFLPLQPISQLWYRPQFPTITLPLVKIPTLTPCSSVSTQVVTVVQLGQQPILQVSPTSILIPQALQVIITISNVGTTQTTNFGTPISTSIGTTQTTNFGTPISTSGKLTTTVGTQVS